LNFPEQVTTNHQ